MIKIKPSIVLVRPQLPENIGMTARAMQNCGLDNLIIVSPRAKWPNEITINSATKAKKIIKKVKIYNSVSEAVANFNFVIATTARKRFLRKPHNTNFSRLFKKIPHVKKIAVLFGPERSGLSNEDLMLSDCIFTIPLSKKNQSLNLSHSVLIFCFKWYEHFNNRKLNIDKKYHISDKNSFHVFMEYLRSELTNSGFLFPKDKANSMFKNIQSMFLRANLSSQEIQTLWGIVKTLKNPKIR